MLMAKKDSISYELAYFTMWAVWKDFTLGQKIRWIGMPDLFLER